MASCHQAVQGLSDITYSTPEVGANKEHGTYGE